MEDGAIVAVVAIVFGTIYGILRMIFGSGRAKVEKVSNDQSAHSQKELFDLALRLQSRVDSLERLLDASQPEWRGKP